jgi:hypothetical protein
MYGNNFDLRTAKAIDAGRREMAWNTTLRSARAAPIGLRLAVGSFLVRVGTRLAPEAARASPAAGTSC